MEKYEEEYAQTSKPCLPTCAFVQHKARSIYKCI